MVPVIDELVHNDIEYADMQLIAEAVDLLRQGVGASAREIGEVFATRNTGDRESFLIEISAQVLAQVDADVGQGFVDVVANRARPPRSPGTPVPDHTQQSTRAPRLTPGRPGVSCFPCPEGN